MSKLKSFFEFINEYESDSPGSVAVPMRAVQKSVKKRNFKSKIDPDIEWDIIYSERIGIKPNLEDQNAAGNLAGVTE